MTVDLLHRALERAAERWPDQVALRLGDSTVTYRQIDDAATRFAGHLVDGGVQGGDRIAVMTTNRVEFVAVVNGIFKVGAAAVLLNPGWRRAEVDHAVALTGPALGVADGDATDLLRTSLGGRPVLDLDHPATAAALATDPRADVDPRVASVDVEPDHDAVLVFSSGTTGLPKAVRHTHRSLMEATGHWVRALGLTTEDRFQVATPPSHILGLLNLLAAAEAGASVRLHRRFDLDAVLAAIENDRITLEMAVAPIALALAEHPHLEDHDLSSLRYIMWGATPVTESVARRVTARTGVEWLACYGASEVPVIACNPVDRPEDRRLDSVGLPPDGVELRVVDLVSGVVLGPGAEGEVQVRAASTMAGYLPEEATAAAFDHGWYRTGDVGWLGEDGWVHLTDRAKEMMKVNGFQVAPAEIEAVLHGHPDVADCAVFGVPDERAGEVPVAAVALVPEATVTDADLQDLVAREMAGYKRLRSVVVVDAIPRLASGKVLRRVLRDEIVPSLVAAGEA